jgi:hypothetical protein
MGSVFLSYRRADSSAWAGRLNDQLELRWGRDLVFQDVEDIEPGDDWRQAIADQLTGCGVFLTVIGPAWLELADEQGRRRITLDDDVLREEIERAIEMCPKVVPVLVGGAVMPNSDQLPQSIRRLADFQAVLLRDDRWTPDVRYLMDQLRQFVIETRPEVLTLDAAKHHLYELQRRFIDALERDRDSAGALELAQKTSRLLDHVLPLYPDDPWLKATRGYSYKNESMALRRLGRAVEADTVLADADRIFKTMVAEDPNDAAAWNGRGSVAAIRGDLQQALELVDKALELDPSYEAAWRDRERLLPELGVREFSVHVGDRVGSWTGLRGTVVAEGISNVGPRVMVQWDGRPPGKLDNMDTNAVTRLDVEAPR